MGAMSKRPSLYQKYVKRFSDFSIALLLIVLLSPVMIITWIVVKVEETHSSPIFKQIRCGQYQKPFTIYKFRSMSSEAPKHVATRDFDDSNKYVSKIGRFIRLTSIDELPQLFNIIAGDMSFVGPRPVIYEESDLIEARNRLGAYDVLPGITGYAQINGRDELEIDKKAEMDAEYSKSLSASMDAYLFLMTIPVVFMRKGNKDKK